MKIRNHDALVSTGERASRELVLGIVDDALDAVDAYRRIHGLMRLEGDVLHVGNRRWDLATKRNVYLIGAGKASAAMARAGNSGSHTSKQ